MKIKRPLKIGITKTFGLGRKLPRLLGLTVVAVVVASTLSMPNALAAAQPGNDYEKLESKFFMRTYPKDTSDARLDRLEKMVFGEAKEGADRERLDSLLKLVPSASNVAESGTAGGDSSAASSKRAPANQPTKSAASSAPAHKPAADDDAGTQYPAVTAIEKKLFGKDFESENVEDRLTRLEKKAFGKISASNDLSERMDALKDKTGIDVARGPAAGSEWNDEDENETDYPAPSSPVARRVPGVPASDSGKSFSGRDVGADLNRAFNRGTGSSGSGSYGMGGGSSYSSGGSGAYGFGGGARSSSPSIAYRGTAPAIGGRSPSSIGSTTPFSGGSAGTRRAPAPVDPDDDDDADAGFTPPPAPRRGVMPPVAPPMSRGGAASFGGGASSGFAVQLDALETQVFGKTYQDGLAPRIERLETTVFPGEKSKPRTPAERISRLTQVIPISGSPSPSISQNPMAGGQDLDGDGQVDMQQIPADQSSIAQQQPQKRGGGLGRIMNSLGSFLGGGMSVGSYPMQSGGGNLVTDPQTGMLLDQFSGNLINPTTGAVVGRKSGMGYATPMPNYGVGSFNNGFSSPSYGNSMYSNPGYGIGGSGVRFGTGGVRFGGGMWP
ncbi:MAG: hypothetical protein SGJ27_07415 [Candidatus Melainabacteria bacterium]|nr:hypothetical protein [Candidatus Melainabacteria bacterium]